MRDDVEYGERGGFRTEPRRGVKRPTLLGDSVPAAQGVPEVGDRFANRVRATLGPRYEVQVIAQGGLETRDEIVLLNDLFERGYGTDLVALVYFPNDITDLVPDWQPSLTELLTEPSWLHAALRSSYVLDFLWWRVHRLANPGVRRYWPMLRDAYEGGPWTAQRERLLAIRDCVRAAGARFAGRNPAMRVASRWHEHPNAAAHAEIAGAVLQFLHTDAGIQRTASPGPSWSPPVRWHAGARIAWRDWASARAIREGSWGPGRPWHGLLPMLCCGGSARLLAIRIWSWR